MHDSIIALLNICFGVGKILPHWLFVYLLLSCIDKSFKKSLSSTLNVISLYLMTLLINAALKNILQFPLVPNAPMGMTQEFWDIVKTKTYGMPSSNSVLVCSLCYAIGLELSKKNIINKIKNLSFVFLTFVTCSEMYRIYYYGYHRFSEIIVGALVSVAIVSLVYKTKIIYNRINYLILILFAHSFSYVIIRFYFHKASYADLFQLLPLVCLIALFDYKINYKK
jgi:hypothetical protein